MVGILQSLMGNKGEVIQHKLRLPSSNTIKKTNKKVKSNRIIS